MSLTESREPVLHIWKRRDSSAASAPGVLVQTLLGQGLPFEALLFGQNRGLFLILLIFSELWLSKMTWQIFPITVGLTSTQLQQCKLKGNRFLAASTEMLLLQ